MNEMKDLELRLRSWAPRGPSAKVERRLFGTAQAKSEEPTLPTFRLSWLAPSAAALVLVCLLFNQRFNPSAQHGLSSSPVIAAIASNHSIYPNLPGADQLQTLSAERYEFTNAKFPSAIIATNL